jgi:hypothetical protein
MSTRQTRRQAAKERAEQEQLPLQSQTDDIVRENGSLQHAPEDSDDSPPENIFLFWPNIIGTLFPVVPRRAQVP